VWRLGDEWAVRLPQHQKAAAKQETETSWLPRIGKGWPFAAPVPVRVGKPSADLGQALVLVGQDGWDALMIGYGTIDARTFSRARAEGVYYSLTFTAERTGPRAKAGWAGLEALGVAHRTR